MRSVRPSKDEDIIKILKEMESLKAEYPAELLAARRAAFIGQLDQSKTVEAADELTSKDQKLVELFGGLKSVENHPYPSQLFASRRAAFRQQITKSNRVGFWHTLRSAIQSSFTRPLNTPQRSSM